MPAARYILADAICLRRDMFLTARDMCLTAHDMSPCGDEKKRREKTTMKKVFALILICMLILCGCGGNNPDATATDATGAALPAGTQSTQADNLISCSNCDGTGRALVYERKIDRVRNDYACEVCGGEGELGTDSYGEETYACPNCTKGGSLDYKSKAYDYIVREDKVAVVCGLCDGAGKIEEHTNICPVCSGSGNFMCGTCAERGWIETSYAGALKELCAQCSGSGQLPCDYCSGEGFLP